MVNALNGLEKKKKFQLVERLCSFFYSYLGEFDFTSCDVFNAKTAASSLLLRRQTGFFHRCHMICAAQEPFVRDLQNAVLQARKDFQKEVGVELRLLRNFLSVTASAA